MTKSKNLLLNYFAEHTALFGLLDHFSISKAVEMVEDCCNKEQTIFTCGNGGSAYAASHYITDWNKMINLSTGKKFRGVSLCDNFGLVTAFANDVAYDEIFSGQLSSFSSPGDLLICISGSGNSQNVINAATYARDNKMRTLGFVGFDGGKLMDICDHSVHIPSFDMQLCEDVHLMLGHIIMKQICGYEVIKNA